jgi:HlyD family secretion protein
MNGELPYGIKMNKLLTIGILSLLSVSLLSCAKSPADKAEKQQAVVNENSKTLVVEPQPNEIVLYYKAKIEPLKETHISSPIDAMVKELHFHYGQKVYKGQTLVILESEQLNKDFNESLTTFLEAKESYENQGIKTEGLEELWKLQAISKDDYLREKQQIANLYLTFLKAEQKLKDISNKIHDHNLEKFISLNFDNLAQIKDAIQTNSGLLHISAPIDGIALLPKKTDDSSNSTESRILLGSAVKAGQGILEIGDLSGLSLNVNISEININDIKAGQKVTVTGAAFPGITLHGVVKEVEIQAKSNANSGLPTFPVKIEIPNVTSKELERVHMGMSVEAKLIIEQQPTIKVPIKALVQQEGKVFAKVMDTSTQQVKMVEVTTGSTTLNDVTVLSGLQAGDKLVIAD